MIVLCCALCATACAIKPELPPRVLVPIHQSAMFSFFRVLTRSFNTETAVCVYGTVKPDSIQIRFLRPAVIDSASKTRVYYQSCSLPDSIVDGRIRYLGVFHNHPPLKSECDQSALDRWTFAGDTLAVLELVGCADSVVVVQKPRHK